MGIRGVFAGFFVLAIAVGCSRAQRDVVAPVVADVAAVGLLDAGDAVCTATLLRERWLLTAAHCVRGRSVGDLRFTLHPRPLESKDASYAAASTVRIHPHFRDRDDDPGVDVALVRLADSSYGAPVTEYPALIEIDTLARGATVWGLGFGVNPDGTHGFRRPLTMTFLEWDSITYGVDKLVRGLAVVVRGPKGEIGCAGDSGSPLLIRKGDRWAIAGIYSTSEGDDHHHHLPERSDCRSGVTAGNYVAVSAFGGWLQAASKE